MNKLLCCLVAAALFFGACKKDTVDIQGKGVLNFEFENVVGNQALVLNTQNYTNALGETFNVSTFKYYVSNIILTKDDGSVYKVPENYFLIDQSEPASCSPKLEDIPAGDYTKISFTIGVDSLRNFAGAQSGALDPLNGMFWTWNSGYIFVKMEGTSTASTSANHQLIFHIGGAQNPVNAIRKASFDISPNVLRIRSDKSPQMHFLVDVNKMFTGTQDISFAQTNMLMGGPKSLQIADNYAVGMFSLDHIHN